MSENVSKRWFVFFKEYIISELFPFHPFPSLSWIFGSEFGFGVDVSIPPLHWTTLWDEWTQRHFTCWLVADDTGHAIHKLHKQWVWTCLEESEFSQGNVIQKSTWTSRPLRLFNIWSLENYCLFCDAPRVLIPRVFDANEQNFATSQLIFSYSARDPPWRFAISMQHSEQWNGSASRLPLKGTWHIIYTYHVSSFFNADSTWSNRYVCFLFTYSIKLYSLLWLRPPFTPFLSGPLHQLVFTVSELFSGEIAKRGYTVRSFSICWSTSAKHHVVSQGGIGKHVDSFLYKLKR